MLFDFTIIGFGVIGVEILHGIKKSLIKKGLKKKKIKIAIIEKNLKNIPGGIAYSQENSKFGFFNNPLRLSHPEFIKWFNKFENKKKIIDFSKSNPSYNLINWAKKNEFILNNRYNDYKEIYLPRLIYSIYLKEKILNFLQIRNLSKISVNFYNGEVKEFKFYKQHYILPNRLFHEFIIKTDTKNTKIKICKTHVNLRKIKSKKIVIGTGVLPPKKIKQKIINKNSNYIWDFYNSGGTNNLVKKIKAISKLKKKVSVIFIGNKAGFLETMQEIENLIKVNKIKINIFCISKNNQTLQKAENSKKFSLFKFKFLINKNIIKIKKAEQILDLLKKEFENAKLNGFNKYDVWTNVLSKKIMSMCYGRLNKKEKNNYNFLVFPLIRNMTRYTYPYTVDAKKRLEKAKKIKFINDKVIKILKHKDILVLETKLKKSIKGDIVINVSGPANITEIKNEIKFISSLKKITTKYNDRGFSTNKNFMLEKNVFLPGTISNNFNPGRETIIKAITKNSHRVANILLN